MTTTFGDPTLTLLEQAFAHGAEHVAVLMRHSARTFNPDIHDLENQLTDVGRELCLRLGHKLPPGLTLRGYASPAQRCVDTAQLILDAYATGGGSVTRVRPVEAFGAFYALDQQRMWKGLQAAQSMAHYVDQWGRGEIPRAAVLPAPLAADLVLQQLVERLDGPIGMPALDVCVTHDLTLMMVRDQLLACPPHSAPIEFLDALVVYRREGALWSASFGAAPRIIESP